MAMNTRVGLSGKAFTGMRRYRPLQAKQGGHQHPFECRIQREDTFLPVHMKKHAPSDGLCPACLRLWRFHSRQSSNSAHTGAWSEGFSIPLISRQIPESTSFSLNTGVARMVSIRSPRFGSSSNPRLR